MNAAVATRLDAESSYFFLSYAHVPPPPGREEVETNRWVRRFYEDLESAVLRGRSTLARPGFCDVLIPTGANRNERAQRELGLTQVLVPLYAPGYFSRSWARSEWDSFVRRAEAAGAVQPHTHICPVLWVPVPPDDRIPDLDRALELGDGIEEYAAEGLQAMARLRFFHDSYQKIVDVLAKRIIAIAEGDTLKPSIAPPLSEVLEKIHLRTPFTVAVLAPRAGTRPRGRRAEPYGEARTQWRPYQVPDELTIAQIASNVVEWFDLDARVEDIDAAADHFQSSPGLVLVDPWVIDHRRGAGGLRDALAPLPPWVSIIVVVDNEDPQYDPRGAMLADRAAQALKGADRQVSIASYVEEFERLLVQNIMSARNAYLRKGRVFPPEGPYDRPPWHDPADGSSTQSEESDR